MDGKWSIVTRAGCVEKKLFSRGTVLLKLLFHLDDDILRRGERHDGNLQRIMEPSADLGIYCCGEDSS